jgi:hypothetical protein
MGKDNPLYSNFFVGLGASIIGGAVAGYMLIQNPDYWTYILLVVVGAIFSIIGLKKSKR